MAKYNIGGYIFNDENSARKAAKELKAVEYILGQIRDSDEEGALAVYKKILDQRLFSTQIGMSFLKQLRQNLVATDTFSEEDIPPVYDLDEGPSKNEPKKTEPVAKEPVKETIKESKKQTAKSEKAKEMTEAGSYSYQIKKLKLINRVLLVCVIALILCVVGMFYVSTTINSPTILNYKETITDQYSSWKEELDEKEKELNDRESKLKEKEDAISGIE